jgi:hypothetical protein
MLPFLAIGLSFRQTAHPLPAGHPAQPGKLFDQVLRRHDKTNPDSGSYGGIEQRIAGKCRKVHV